MANWNQVRDFIHATYASVEDKQDLLVVNLVSGDASRKHLVMVSPTGNDTVGEWVVVEAPIGKLADLDVGKALAMIEEESLVCGGLGKVGDFLTLRDTFPIADLSAEELSMPIDLIVGSADRFEEVLVGADVF